MVDTSIRQTKPALRPTPLDVSAQLDDLRDLRDGWYEGDGLAPSHDGLNWLADSFGRYYPEDTPLPYAYPTFEGGVRMEWSHRNNAIILEINLISHRGEWLWFDRDSDAEQERILDLDDRHSWDWLAAAVRIKTTGTA